MAPAARHESEDVDVSPLGKPLNFEFSGKIAPTRFMKAAMSERLATWDPKILEKRGIPTPNLINVYKRWGEGGFGVILSGNIMMYYDQLETMGATIVPPAAEFSGERFEAFKEMAKQAKAHGSLFVGQVSHPGRQTEDRLQKDPVSASDVQLQGDVMGMTFAKPHAATQDEINKIVDGFGHTAEYLEQAGFDGIELHGAHGYLLAQFLAQSTNRRTDKYGGSLENRARIIFEIAEEVRRRTKPDFILGIKLNSVEFQEKGFSPDEAKQLCALLDSYRFDFVELSGGTYEAFGWEHKRESTKKREAFFLEFADAITPSLKRTKSFITGGFLTAGAMVHALDVVDGVGLGRPVCQEFQLPRLILQGKVKGAIKQRFDHNNFAVTVVAAGTQIRQVGQDHEPIDLSLEENEKAFVEDMGGWMEKMSKDAEMISSGYIDIARVPSIPYGPHA